MAIIIFKWLSAIDFRNDMDNYRQCYECKMANHVSRSKCWMCQSTDLREYQGSYPESIDAMIIGMGEFNIPIGIKSIIS